MLQLVTSSADKSLKYWDMASLSCIKTVVVGSALADMQNSVFWSNGGGPVVSLSLDGNLNFFAPGGDAPSLVVSGHQVCMCAFVCEAYDSMHHYCIRL